MDPESAIETSREAIKVCIMVGGPILAICLIVGLLMGIAQAMSNIQDQALATVPKILAIMAVIGLALPWFADRMMEFSKDQFSRPLLANTAPTWEPTHPNTVESLLSEPNADEDNYYQRPQATAKVRQAAFTKQQEPANASSKAEKKETPNPFSLPSYRFSRKPSTNIEG